MFDCSITFFLKIFLIEGNKYLLKIMNIFFAYFEIAINSFCDV